MTVDFDKLLEDPRDVEAPPGSINAQLLALPQRRKHTHDMKGRVLRFPRTGIIGVPFELNNGGSWDVVVIDGSACVTEEGRTPYPRGGYHINVSDLEMQTADEFGPVTRHVRRGVVRNGLLYLTYEASATDVESFSMSTDFMEVPR